MIARWRSASQQWSDPPAMQVRAGELPAVGVLTMARDEGPMLRRWVEHYATEVGADRVVVIDDNSSDGSTDDLPCTVIRIPYLHKKSFEPARMGLVSGIAAGLLEAYDALLFCDADEFVVADPDRYETLRHFVAARDRRTAIGVTALNVIHDAQREPALRDDAPILGQRRLVKFTPLMCKPALTWVPAGWGHASHGIKCPYEIDPDLFMFHMKFADRGHLEEVAARRHHLHETEGRAKNTSWARPSDAIVALLDEATAGVDPDALTAFSPDPAVLAKIVQHRGPLWRAVGHGVVPAMRLLPFQLVPERFVGRV